MLPDDLLAILCCPTCHGELVYDNVKDSLRCKRCLALYSVEHGIPMLLPDKPPEKRKTDGAKRAG